MFKRILIGLVLLGVVGALCGAMFWNWRGNGLDTRFRQATLAPGRIVLVVNSSGTVQPVKSVQVGAFVSAPIERVFVDFNSEVKEGDLLAQIDKRLFTANVAQSEANLARSKADQARAEAVYENAKNNEERALKLRATKKTFISDQELDQFIADRKSYAAQVELAKASVKQADASLSMSKQNLDYTEIRSPVSGLVIDRKVDEGQTVVASFQTPTLFVVAPDLKQKIHVYAAVDEADIGLIRKAEEEGRAVQFFVDAYPDDLFEGKIEQIRKLPTTNQGVVTYTVVVAAPNEELKLLPGMTANLSFQIQDRANALRIPNAALRFYPKAADVRPEDRPLLEGSDDAPPPEEGAPSTVTNVSVKQSAEDLATASRLRSKRHVWVIDGPTLRAIPVTVGINDAKYTEWLSGEIKAGDKVVTGVKSTLTGGAP